MSKIHRTRSKKHPITAKPSKIIDEWKWLLKSFYNEEKMKKVFCFMCGCEKSEYDTIYRHHILMECDGGKDTPDNLILVCQDCHKIAPTRNIDEPIEIIKAKLLYYIQISQFLNLINDMRHFTNKVNLNEFFMFIEKNNYNGD